MSPLLLVTLCVSALYGWVAWRLQRVPSAVSVRVLLPVALLAHGVRPNHSKDRVRMAQYISMYPADEDNEEEREARIRMWRELEPPQRDAFPGDPREWEKKHATTARLSPLGEKLLGLRSWH